MPIRLFFAVLLPEPVREAVLQVQQQLRELVGEEGLRWVAPEQFHYTLKFLGQTAEEHLPDAIAAANTAAMQRKPFQLTVAHIGGPQPHHKREHHAQILYAFVDIEGKSFPLMHGLAESLESALVTQGFVAEKRGYLPHLTLARIRSSVGAKAARKLFNEKCEELFYRYNCYGWFIKVDKIGSFKVDSFSLVQSELRPSGPVYTVLETFLLSASAR